MPESNVPTQVDVLRCRIGTDVAFAAECLRSGGLVGMPTETVYGLAASALQPQAVAAVFDVKRRPHFDPLIVHLSGIDQLPMVAKEIPERAYQLAERCWPGPLTMILPRTAEVPDLVTAGLPGTGVRIPAHPMARQLIAAAGFPLAAPSANLFGCMSPTTAEHVRDGLGNSIDYVLDGGPCSIGVESTVISLMEEQPVLLRHGGLPLEELEQIIGPIVIAAADPDAHDRAQPAPGMLSRHYAPRTRMQLIPAEAEAHPVPGIRNVLLTWGNAPVAPGFDRIHSLGPAEDLRICAAGFFAALRMLDALAPDVIIAREFTDSGLGRALNDRLRRGAAGSEQSHAH